MVWLVVLAWVVVAIGIWVGYQLIQQNGRILTHLDRLESRLADLTQRSAQPIAAAPALPSGLVPGTPAPAFELPDLAGQPHSLSEWQGRTLLLIFFNPGCGFCQHMAPDIAALPIDDNAKPLPLIVSTGSVDDNRKWVAEHGVKCPVLLQQQMEVASRYKVSGTPIGYLVNETGHIASAMATGAPSLLSLLDVPPQSPVDHVAHDAPGHAFKSHDLSRSKIKRDGLTVGTQAPDFVLPRIDGGELALDDLRGKPVLLLFSDPGCGPCQLLSAQLGKRWTPQAKVQLLMVSRGSVEANQAKANEHGLRFPIVLQKQWEISKLYAMFATPVGYLVNEDGVIASEVAIGMDPILALWEQATAMSAATATG